MGNHCSRPNDDEIVICDAEVNNTEVSRSLKSKKSMSSGQMIFSPSHSSNCRSSSSVDSKTLKASHYMPTFTLPSGNDCSLDKDEEFLLRRSWEDITNGNTEPLRLLMEVDTNLRGGTIFFTKFYKLFFQLVPGAASKFTGGIKKQGDMMAQIIKFILDTCTEGETEKFKSTIVRLAARHNERGVSIQWYSPMGTALLITIRECSGTLYTDEIDIMWRKALTQLFRVMIPVVVARWRTSDINLMEKQKTN